MHSLNCVNCGAPFNPENVQCGYCLSYFTDTEIGQNELTLVPNIHRKRKRRNMPLAEFIAKHPHLVLAGGLGLFQMLHKR